jgi:predicted transcriptional regulator of viral defense system
MKHAVAHGERIIDFARKTGAVRSRDLEARGIPRVYLTRLVRRGRLERVGRGLYRLSDAHATEHRSLAEAAKRVPHGVVCLLSALRFHGLTTQIPFQVWMAIHHKAWAPRADGPPLRVIRMSGAALESGVETHRIDGVEVRVFSPAKTVADCFKFRSKVGLDVALEALRDYRRAHPAGMGELWRYARTDRVSRVIRPYLEALG